MSLRQASRSQAHATASGSCEDAATGPRKRAKKTPAAPEFEDGGEDADTRRKRARGRPRLDTTDETAADRRRTQIRLAQRAYRNRKETTITALEKEVQGLRNANEEMSAAFMKLHDFALGQGLLDQSPEFGQYLQATTEKFLALARTLHDNGESDEGHDRRGGQTRRDETSSPDSISTTLFCAKTAAPQPPHQHQAVYGGIMVSHQALPDFGSSAATVLHGNPMTAPLGYEIGPDAAAETSTFPCSSHPPIPVIMTADSSSSSFYHNHEAYPAASPWLSLGVPQSYAREEVNLGRRLQRVCLEKGVWLLSQPTAPVMSVARVFGFVLTYESKEEALERMRQLLNRTKQETLFNWNFPCYNAGRAGMNYPFLAAADYDSDYTTSSGGDSHQIPSPGPSADPLAASHTPALIGNQGLPQINKRKDYQTFFATGPFLQNQSEMCDMLGDDMRITLPIPGFDTVFLDPDEVQYYLQSMGIFIPPDTDEVVLEVDTSVLTKNDALPSSLPGASTPRREPKCDPSLSQLLRPTLVPQHNASGADIADIAADLAPAQDAAGFDASAAWQALLSSTQAQDTSSYVLPGLPLRAAPPIPALGTRGGHGGPLPSSKRLVRLNVDHFVNSESFNLGGFTASSEQEPADICLAALAVRSTCLGRTPGTRRADVHDAFWLSARDVLE